MELPQPRNTHEGFAHTKEDTRMMVHVGDAAKNGYTNVIIGLAVFVFTLFELGINSDTYLLTRYHAR